MTRVLELPPGSEGRTRLTQLAVGSFTPRAADALVAGDLVLAGAPMQARLGSALVNFWERSSRVREPGETPRIKLCCVIRGNGLKLN